MCCSFERCNRQKFWISKLYWTNFSPRFWVSKVYKKRESFHGGMRAAPSSFVLWKRWLGLNNRHLCVGHPRLLLVWWLSVWSIVLLLSSRHFLLLQLFLWWRWKAKLSMCLGSWCTLLKYPSYCKGIWSLSARACSMGRVFLGRVKPQIRILELIADA